MDRLDAPETMPDTVSDQIEPPTPLQERIAACCAETAQTFRGLQAISAQIAFLIETNNGTVADLVGLVEVFERLREQAGERMACLGAAVSSSGSA